MDYRERTSALFAYLTHENATLKEEVADLRRLVEQNKSKGAENELRTANSRLREQMLTMEAEVLLMPLRC